MANSLTLRHFAAARELAGCELETVTWQQGTVTDLRALLAQRAGRWAFLAKVARYARNDEFLNDSELLLPGDEILVLPPAAGGAPRAHLVDAPIAPGAAERLVELAGTGGICSFVGTVRATSHGQAVVSLDYSAYRPMALQEMQRICDEAVAQFALIDAQAIHRLGLLQVGEVAVAIACAAPHRQAAFDATQFVINELKARVPIWKKETTADGSVWVGSTP